jgi:hypothetical protein
MSNSANQFSAFDFGKLVPGFDFLQNLTQAAGKNASPSTGAAGWVAPTLNVEDIQKRIEELKAVQFWLEQNSRALSATIQALEVQKMTLSTLSAMNVSMGDLASALQLKPTPKTQAPEASPEPEDPKTPKTPKTPEASEEGKAGVDPLAWWGAVTQQFQQIASHVLKEVPLKTAPSDAAKSPASKTRPSKPVTSKPKTTRPSTKETATRPAAASQNAVKAKAVKAPAKKTVKTSPSL